MKTGGYTQQLPPADGRLTVRQTEIMALAAQGLSAKKIARRLGIKFYTAATHLKNAYRKLGVRNRVSAVARFYQPICPNCGCEFKTGIATSPQANGPISMNRFPTDQRLLSSRPSGVASH